MKLYNCSIFIDEVRRAPTVCGGGGARNLEEQSSAGEEVHHVHGHQWLHTILEYTTYLTRELVMPRALLNYSSGARSGVRLLGGNPSAFDIYQMALMRRGVQRASTHVPVPVSPISAWYFGPVRKTKTTWKAGQAFTIMVPAALTAALWQFGGATSGRSHHDVMAAPS